MRAPPERLEGTVELVGDARGELPARRFQLTLAHGRVDITELDETDAEPGARVSGPVSAWVHALGPEGSMDGLQISGEHALADAVLAGFARAGARRAVAAA